MREYKIKIVDDKNIDWDKIPKAKIENYVWGGEYRPQSISQLVMVKDYGFVLKMKCFESEPKAIYNNYNDPVYKDSCLEFFAIFDNAQDKYINMEINSKGTLLSCIGEGRAERTPIAELTGGKIFDVSSKINSDFWEVLVDIPFEMLSEIYNMDTDLFKSGYNFKGNFYKCGDETFCEHYGMWNEIETKNPDFHRPEYFGSLIIE